MMKCGTKKDFDVCVKINFLINEKAKLTAGRLLLFSIFEG